MATIVASSLGVGGQNIVAFLDTIAWAEGTPRFGKDQGYNVIVGGALFDDYSTHPRRYVTIRLGGKSGLVSSAAGRYQFLWRTWEALRKRLSLPDFGPLSQDKGAIELLDERGALRHLRAGNLTEAINRSARIWASLPGAGYGQPEKSQSEIKRIYRAAGGTSED